MKTDTQKLRVHLRWMIKRDIPEVLDIEQNSFADPWQENDFIQHLRQRNCIGFVAEYDDHIVAFFVYTMNPTHIHIENFAVANEFRGEGVGTACIDKLKDKLSPNRRRRITVNVRESNLAAQKFFAACGFRAVNVLHDTYDNCDEDAYRFVFRIRDDADPCGGGDNAK